MSDRLFPEFKGRLRVRVVRSPQLNAFALPNGSLYINEGLLARFENEGQLATVLAHEGAHFRTGTASSSSKACAARRPRAPSSRCSASRC